MDKKTLEKGNALATQIEDCKSIYDALSKGTTVNLSVYSTDDSTWHTYPLPKALLVNIQILVGDYLKGLEKALNEL